MYRGSRQNDHGWRWESIEAAGGLWYIGAVRISSGEQQFLSSAFQALKTLLTGTPDERTITGALAGIGAAAGVDRTYVFQITVNGDGAEHASQRYEWTSPNVEPQIDNPDLQDIPLRAAGYGRWLDQFMMYQPIAGSLSAFPADEKPLLEEQGILSLLVVPIYIRGSLWGFVGFDDCSDERNWTPADVDLLITISIALASILDDSSGDILATATKTYLNLVSRLLEFQTLLFTETSQERLFARTHVRLRVLARSYQYFSGIDVDGSVSLPDYLRELRALFTEVRSVDFEIGDDATALEVDDIALSLPRALDVAIILAEVLAVISELRYADVYNANLVVSIHRADDRVELTLTAWDRDGTPIGNGTELDATALSLFHMLQERFDAKISTTGFDGLLLRVSFRL